jgi:hypothetical protein
MKKAQSILEYVIILSVIVGAFILGSSGMANKIQTGRNSLGNRAGRAYGLEASLTALPTPTDDPTDPDDPTPSAMAIIPTSVYLTPGELAMLDAAGILQGGRSDYDPPSRVILRVGLSAEQNRVIDAIQAAVNRRYGVG